ncbi:uncharacterized protein LOC104068360 [Cuculus canorus]|nr:uncharacterized protein LOC104068360 [Cuculus canorus]
MKAFCLRILFALSILRLVIPAGGQPKAPLKCSTECGRFTSEISAKRIRSYRRTEPSCKKQAFIFITVRSVELCADPAADWVKKIVEKLDQKKATESSLPRDPKLAAAPEGPGIFQKHIGLTATVPPQAPTPTIFFQGTGTTVLERTYVPADRVEASSKSPPASQNTTQLHAGLSPAIRETAARSEVSPEANREPLKSAPSTAFAANTVSSQPTLHPPALVHGFDKAVGSMEEAAGDTANATAYVQDMTSPSSNSDPVVITKGSDHPVHSTNESLDTTNARVDTPETASSRSSSFLPSILDSKGIATVPATPVPPEITSASILNPTTAIGEGSSARTNKVARYSADAFGTKTFGYSSSVGKQDPSDMLVFTSQASSGQAKAQVTTERPNNLPLPSFLSRSQMNFVIPVSVVGGLMACSVAAAWLYLKFGIKAEEMSREMVQGLLYEKRGHESNAYPMEVV